jgi:hypothetical protein
VDRRRRRDRPHGRRREALANDDVRPLPAAVGATAVLARTQGGLRAVVTAASGPSGARLLGRFCHSDPERHVRAPSPRPPAPATRPAQLSCVSATCRSYNCEPCSDWPAA